MFAADVGQPRDQAGNAPGVARSGDANNRDAAIFFGVEKVFNNGLSNRAPRAFGGFNVGQ